MSSSERAEPLDVVVVGAGFAGMYAIWKLRQTGLNLRVIEAASDVGGTWYWNRYPGARCDITSMEYSYGFSEELQQDWEWTEIMAAQPEILSYANHVADRFALRDHIDFNTRVTGVHYLEENSLWEITTDAGQRYRARYCIMATGCLSVPNTPVIEGQDEFAGKTYHTGNWPAEGVDFTGKTVGIIGTGSSGVQSIPVIARQAKHLTVLQRTPNYNLPANNAPLPDEYRSRIKRNYKEVRKAQRHAQIGVSEFSRGLGGLGSNAEPKESILQTSPEDRVRALDELGFEALRQYNDLALNPQANELACDMYREQVRRVVNDPETAEGLMPRDYAFGCKRPVIDIGYYETFNRHNVSLVDLRRGGIERITSTGIRTAQGHFEFDVLVYATGFDAMTGALLRMDIRGRDGRTLASHWEHGPKTYLGLQMTGFPNLFTVTGPGSPSVLSNMVVSVEQHVDWISDCINYLDQKGAGSIEPTAKAEDAWVRHVFEIADGTMLTDESCNSWYLGANIPGKPRIFMPYVAGVGAYGAQCDAIAAEGYRGFVIG
ncbi:MAG: NAD(P)/FAD-dependent oxidoreductase [Proteobacteria bacterium]|nr:NAD(P)/FAD-dependent oxidoreductase [Pseudomonadota bacterium]